LGSGSGLLHKLQRRMNPSGDSGSSTSIEPLDGRR